MVTVAPDDEDEDAERNPEGLPIELDTYEGHEGSAVDDSGGVSTEDIAKKDRVRATDSCHPPTQ